MPLDPAGGSLPPDPRYRLVLRTRLSVRLSVHLAGRHWCGPSVREKISQAETDRVKRAFAAYGCAEILV